MNWSGELLSRQVGRTLPEGSLDIHHLIIILKWDAVNDVVVISVIYVFVRLFENICKILDVSCFCLCYVFEKYYCDLCIKVYIFNFIVKTTLFQM